MSPSEPLRVGYVVKRYPRFSETFVVNEILAHEQAGLPLHIFAVRRVNETHFQPLLAKVRAPVTYISDSAPKAETLWAAMREGATTLPEFWRHAPELSRGDPLDAVQAIRLAIEVRRAGIGHLHAHFATVATTVTRLAAALAGISYSFTAHAKDIFHEEVDAADLRQKMEDAAAVVTVSDYNLKFLHAKHGHRARAVRRIYNGIDTSLFRFRSPRDRRREILAVGRLVEKKGFDVLLEACALLKSRDLPFRCSIVGEGPCRADLAAAIERLGLSDRCALAGPLPQTGVIEALHRAAVFAAPCVVARDADRDGLPTVLIEAMALGTPCVSTRVTGIPELVRHGETGFCIEPRDPVALADALEVLLADAELRVGFAEAARALVEQAFDVERNAALLREIFAEAASAGDRLREVST